MSRNVNPSPIGNVNPSPIFPIFDIRRFSLDDGPGIRTTVFLKGCPLSCVWCHNPESIRSDPEIAFYPQLCIGCGDCRRVCPQGAVSFESTDRIIRNKCIACGRCAEECPTTALKLIGRYYSVSNLVEKLLKDHIFYQTSKGGVTFSGGEPTLHMDYLSEIIRELKKNAIHLALQTSGMFDLAEFQIKILPYIDLIFYDLKLFDASGHKHYTGRSNEQILRNLTDLKNEKVKIVPRVPLIPGITNTPKNLNQIDEFLKSIGYSTYELLPFNPVGMRLPED